jgi:hypothetical protein
MNPLRTLRFDLEELDALRLAQKHGDTVSERYRAKFTPTPSVKYYSQIQVKE